MDNSPRPYDLNQPEERARLIAELIGYMRVSKNHGTDSNGRWFAWCALRELQRGMEQGKYILTHTEETSPVVSEK